MGKNVVPNAGEHTLKLAHKMRRHWCYSERIYSIKNMISEWNRLKLNGLTTISDKSALVMCCADEACKSVVGEALPSLNKPWYKQNIFWWKWDKTNLWNWNNIFWALWQFVQSNSKCLNSLNTQGFIKFVASIFFLSNRI